MPYIEVLDTIVSEKSRYAEFVVRLDAPAQGIVQIQYTTANGSASAGAGDFTPTEGLLSFNPGEIEKIVRVPIADDRANEGFESFFLVLSRANGAEMIRTHGIATIVDNDAAAGTPIVSVRDIFVDEGAGTATFTVLLDRPARGEVTMDWAIEEGSARARADFAAGAGALRFGAGQTARTVTVRLRDDARAEGLETFDLVLSNLSNASGGDLRATAFIAPSDQPAAARPHVSILDTVVGEADGFAEFVVMLDAPSAAPVSLEYTTFSLSASSGADDFVPYAATLGFAPGETLKTIRVPLIATQVREPIETFGIELSRVSGGEFSRPTAIGTIVDRGVASDAAPTIQVRGMAVDEGAGFAVFTVMLGGASTEPLTFTYATVAGEARARDFTRTAGTIQFAPGETVKAIVVPIADDSEVEGIESFSLALRDASGALVPGASAVATIYDNDAAPVALPTVSVLSTSVGEGDGYVDVVIALSAPSAAAVKLEFTTVSGSATSSADDFEPHAASLAFVPGEVVKSVRIGINDDRAVDPRESFFVEISRIAGAAPGATRGTITIIDNDRAAAGDAGFAAGPFVPEKLAGVSTLHHDWMF